jgi:lipopolysaccharide export system permease protein
VNVKGVEGRKLIKPIFSFRATEDNPAITITAEEAEIRSKPGSGLLTISFRNGVVETGNTRFQFNDTFEHEIPLGEATRKNAANESPSHMEMRVLPQRIAAQQALIERSEQDLAAQTAYQLLSGDFGSLGGQAWSAAAATLAQQRLTLYRLKTEVPRRWANGFSCLCFTMVGAAVAIRRRTDALKSFFVCFLPILGIYYPLMMSSVDRAKSGAFPPYAVWLANVLLLLAGAWMLRKVVRY